jgi:hypothetical protein
MHRPPPLWSPLARETVEMKEKDAAQQENLPSADRDGKTRALDSNNNETRGAGIEVHTEEQQQRSADRTAEFLPNSTFFLLRKTTKQQQSKIYEARERQPPKAHRWIGSSRPRCHSCHRSFLLESLSVEHKLLACSKPARGHSPGAPPPCLNVRKQRRSVESKYMQ